MTLETGVIDAPNVGPGIPDNWTGRARLRAVPGKRLSRPPEGDVGLEPAGKRPTFHG